MQSVHIAMHEANVREKIKAGLWNKFQIKPDFPALLRGDSKYSRLFTTLKV